MQLPTPRNLFAGLGLLLLGVQSMPAQTQTLEQQIDELREKLQGMDTLEQKLDDVEQQLKADEERKQAADQQTEEKAKTSASVSAGANGFLIQSGRSESGEGPPDFLLNIGADIQTDVRSSGSKHFTGPGSNPAAARAADVLRHRVPIHRFLHPARFRAGADHPLRRLCAAQLLLPCQAPGRQVQAARRTGAAAIGRRYQLRRARIADASGPQPRHRLPAFRRYY